MTDTPAGALTELLTSVLSTSPQGAMANAGSIGIDNEDVTASQFDSYKGRKDQTDRITVLLPGNIYFARTHYVESGDKKGYYICASNWRKLGSTESLVQPAALCCQRLEPPKQRFSALILHYNTTPKGAIVAPFAFKPKVWRFNAGTFEQLRTAHREFPLTAHDLLVTCTDDQYQRMTIQSCKDSVAATPDFLKVYGVEVQGWVAGMMPKIDSTAGRRLDAAGWAELLGGVVPGAGVGSVTPQAADAPVDIAALLNIGGVTK